MLRLETKARTPIIPIATWTERQIPCTCIDVHRVDGTDHTTQITTMNPTSRCWDCAITANFTDEDGIRQAVGYLG